MPIAELLPRGSERTSCLDSVPTCGKTCGRRLACSTSGGFGVKGYFKSQRLMMLFNKSVHIVIMVINYSPESNNCDLKDVISLIASTPHIHISDLNQLQLTGLIVEFYRMCIASYHKF